MVSHFRNKSINNFHKKKIGTRYAHWYGGLKAQCLVSIWSPLPTNAQWIDLIRIVQKISIYDRFVTSVKIKNQKSMYVLKKITFLRIFWLRAKSHHSIFP